MQRSLSTPMLFDALPAAMREELTSGSRPQRFSDGQIIQQRGEEAEGFWLIDQGIVRIGQFLPHGEFRGVALLGPGDSYGELAWLAAAPRVVDAVSRGESVLRYIAGTRLDPLLAADPSAARSLLGAMARQMQELLDIIAGIRRGTALARVAGLLATFAQGSDEQAEVTITQQELGELLGLTRASVNASLRELEKLGLLERRYGAITILSPQELQLASLD